MGDLDAARVAATSALGSVYDRAYPHRATHLNFLDPRHRAHPRTSGVATSEPGGTAVSMVERTQRISDRKEAGPVMWDRAFWSASQQRPTLICVHLTLLSQPWRASYSL